MGAFRVGSVVVASCFLVAPSHADGTVVCGSMSSGGGRGQSSSAVLDGTFGGPCDDIRSAPDTTLCGGYAGQLYEAVAILASASTTNIPEASSSQLSAAFTNDDGSFTTASAQWTVLSGPIAVIDSNGAATAGVVYQDSQALVAASSEGLSAELGLVVLDTLKDNFGLYANDGIADSWQADYFGTDNTNALATADADHDGASNYAEFIAGTSPVNDGDFFSVQSIRRDAEGGVEAVLSPAFSNRSYRIEGAVSLDSPNWTPLDWHAGPTQATQLAITDIAATNNISFFRAAVDYEW